MKLRVLGLYAAVHLLEGCGVFHSRRHGEVHLREHDTLLFFPEEPTRYFPD